MRVVATVFPDPEVLGQALAKLIADELVVSAERGGVFLLGCPGGRSALSSYQALAGEVSRRRLDLSHLVIVMMDEYVVPGADGVLRRVDPGESYSCLGFARREILEPIAQACRAAGTTPPDEIWAPDPADPDAYDGRLTSAGGVDVFLLASGASDGHIAFNQPGTPRTARTHVAPLGVATRRDNMATFPEFTRLEMVPEHGVTVGVGTIASLSHEVVMIVCGAQKQHAFDRLTTADSYQPDWPATVAVECTNPLLVADPAAAGR